MSVEKPKTSAAELAQLAAVVDLVDVRPVEFHAQLVRDAPDVGTPVEIGVQPELETAQDDGHGFAVRASFSVKAHAKEAEAEPFLEIRYVIIGRYQLPGDFTLNQDLLTLFSRTNGMVHFWPYLRAFVSSTCGQLGLPPMVLPPFRIQGPRARPAKKPALPAEH